jgi:hypothetical protein
MERHIKYIFKGWSRLTVHLKAINIVSIVDDMPVRVAERSEV